MIFSDFKLKINKYFIVIAFILSAFFILIVNLCIGTYFVDYEVIINSLFLHEITTHLEYPYNYLNFWTGVSSLMSSISDLLKNVSFYSSLHTLLNIIFFTIITSFIWIDCRKSKDNLIAITTLILSAYLLFFDSIFLTINWKLAINFTLTGILSIYIYCKHHYVLAKYLSYILVLIALVIRFEIVIIAILSSIIYVIFLSHRKLLPYILKYSILSLLVFTGFKFIQGKYFPEDKYIQMYEHEVIDRTGQRIIYDNDSNLIVKRLAMNRFIKDDNKYTWQDYKGIIDDSQKHIKFNKDTYINILKNNISIHSDSIKLNYQFYIIYFLFITLLILNKKTRSLGIKKSLVFFALILIFLLSNLYLLFPLDILNTLLFWLFLTTIWHTIFLLNLKKNVFIYASILFFVLLSYGKTVTEELRLQRVFAKKSYYYRSLLEEFSKQGKTVVYSNFPEDFSNYPSKLFDINPMDKINHYYIDMFYFSMYSFYINHHKPFFGKNMKNLIARLEKIANKNNIVLISNTDQLDFYKMYAEKLYNIKIDYKEIQTPETFNIDPDLDVLKPYCIYMTANF